MFLLVSRVLKSSMLVPSKEEASSSSSTILRSSTDLRGMLWAVTRPLIGKSSVSEEYALLYGLIVEPSFPACCFFSTTSDAVRTPTSDAIGLPAGKRLFSIVQGP